MTKAMLAERQPRIRDKGYLAALHDLPCLHCGTHQNVEAAHIRLTNHEWERKTGVKTGAGGAEKPHDRWCLPLCSTCHREGPEAEHRIGTVAFYRRWGVDPHRIANELFTAYPDRDLMASVATRVLVFGFGRVG